MPGETPLQTADPGAIGLFRVNGNTVASVNDTGEVTIRQTRRTAIPSDDPKLDRLAGGPKVEVVELIVKLSADDFARVGRMVGALHGGGL